LCADLEFVFPCKPQPIRTKLCTSCIEVDNLSAESGRSVLFHVRGGAREIGT
jgi:hypothetical protein